VLAVSGTAVTLAFVFPNTAKHHRELQNAGKAEPLPQPEAEPRTVGLTPAARAAALKTAADFIRTAVVRHRVGLSWQLTAPSLRAGYTQKEWRKGNIPVVPYPLKSLASVRWRLNHSYRDDVGLNVLLLPRRGSSVPPTAFEIDLRAFGRAKRKHWLVESWTPSGVSPPSLTPSERRAAAAAASSSKPLGALWLLAPVGVLALLLLLPFAVLVRGWRANRRAERAYRDSLQLERETAA
jgi:hypothetical protein